jgi:hypothetical protein
MQQLRKKALDVRSNPAPRLSVEELSAIIESDSAPKTITVYNQTIPYIQYPFSQTKRWDFYAFQQMYTSCKASEANIYKEEMEKALEKELRTKDGKSEKTVNGTKKKQWWLDKNEVTTEILGLTNTEEKQAAPPAAPPTTKYGKGLSLFTTLKSPVKVRNLNAIRSWTKIKPKPEIVIFMDEDDDEIRTLSKRLGVEVANITYKQYGRPLMNGLFKEAQRLASNALICYANADILFFNDIMRLVDFLYFAKVSDSPFLVTGRRWDYMFDEHLDFSDPFWAEKLKKKVLVEGTLDSTGWAMDYFILPKHWELQMPPFLVGQPRWDSWLFDKTRSSNTPVFDATQVTTVVHFGHSSTWSLNTNLGAEMVKLSGRMRYYSVHDAGYELLPCVDYGCSHPIKARVKPNPKRKRPS